MADENTKVNVNIESIGNTESKVLDISPLVGKKATIENIEIHKGKLFDGKQSYYALAKTGVVGKVEEQDIIASKLLNLGTDEEGNQTVIIGSKTHKFLKSVGCESLAELKGKTVQCQKTEPNDAGHQFLTF